MGSTMKKEIPLQLIVAAIILLGGGTFVGFEYFFVKLYPGHRQRMNEETLKGVPYSNASLGIEIQVAEGIYGRAEPFAGGVRIAHRKFWGIGPSLTITSQPNPDNTAEFSPQILAKWETQGVYQSIPRYRFEHTKINNRDAVLIWQIKGRYMQLTARVIAPDRIIEAECTPGQEDEALFLEACESSLRTLKIAGPEPPPAPTPLVQEIASPAAGAPSTR
jgi:hypothetical protein